VGESNKVRTVTQDQLSGLIRGLDNANDYCGRTGAYDSQRTIRECAAALCLMDAERQALQSQLAHLSAERDALAGDLNIARLQMNAKLCSECPRSDELAHLTQQRDGLREALSAYYSYVNGPDGEFSEIGIRAEKLARAALKDTPAQEAQT
jgi:hypothetical protein